MPTRVHMYKVFNLMSLIPPEMNAKNKEKTNKHKHAPQWQN